MREKIYDWMLRNLPFKMMYHKVPFDGAFLWRPRFGWSKSQLEKAKKSAEERFKNIKWS